MKQLLLIFGLFITLISKGQENNTTDFLTKIRQYDISDLLTLDKFQVEDDTIIVDRPEPLGFIGENYQRFYIHFISVIQNPADKLEYFVYGKTRVKTNICSFQGRLTITESKTYIKGDFPPLTQGFIKGDYEFFEDPDQKGTGVFKGTFTSNFYIDKKGILKYDALMFVADGFENNQFEGTWVSYNSGNSKKCNWGDFRIPDSGDFDGGAGEFSPDEKYKDSGWENYQLSREYSSDKPGVLEARKKENEKWWLDCK